MVHTGLVVERIGIFGGTFDPPHTGHVMVAAEVRDRLRLDRMLVVVAGDPWQKADAVVALARDRLELASVAFGDVAGVEVSAIEVDRAGPTYTIDTVEELSAPGRDLVVVLGADAAARLPTWHRAAELARLVTIAIVARAHEHIEHIDGFRIEHVAVPMFEISSSEVRARLAAGRPIDGLVPAAVIREVRARRLYTAGDDAGDERGS